MLITAETSTSLRSAVRRACDEVLARGLGALVPALAAGVEGVDRAMGGTPEGKEVEADVLVVEGVITRVEQGIQAPEGAMIIEAGYANNYYF